jgi:diguanylate cyclase (GGDEF)-like protein
MEMRTETQQFQNAHQLDLLNELVTAAWLYDIENFCIIWANKAAMRLWESDSLQELYSRDFREGSSDAVQQMLANYQKLFQSGQSLSRLWRLSPKGILKEVFCNLSGVTLKDGRTGMLVEAAKDFQSINSDKGSVVTLSTYTLDGQFLSGNPPFLDTQEPSFAHLSQLFVHSEDNQRILNTIEHNGKFEGDVQIYVNQQSLWHRLVITITENDSQAKSLLVQQFNIEQRKQKELALEKEVVTDPLTGLYNRRGLKQALRNKDQFVVFYIDLDGFKLVNDSLGHNVGDLLLRHLANKLTTDELKIGTACRCGGDEFLWLLETDMADVNVEYMANLLIKKMSEPYIFDKDGRSIAVSASVGIAQYPNDDNDFDQLILKADAAMYVAKKQGKHRWVNYELGMEETLQRHSQLVQYLYRAIENNEFELYYQPIFNVQTKSINSFEALLRWKSPELGMVPTDQCIKVAEEIGVITDIEKWVIKTAIKDINELRKICQQDISVAINITGHFFTNSQLTKILMDELKKHQLQTDAINIELTESTLLSDAHQGGVAAQKINRQQIAISIDDFGTGYSSLSYLHKIPATFVKIDRSFAADVEQDQTMVACIQQLLSSLQFQMIVEGVESLSQSETLKSLGLILQQGYGLGLPQPLSFYQKPKNINLLAGLN